MAVHDVISVDAAMASVRPSSTLWIALSGGLDSVCLFHLALHARARLLKVQGQAPGLYAVHVNHQLQPAAADFEAFSRQLCQQHHIPLRIEPVMVTESGQGPEAAARAARYAAFERCLAAGDTLWLAQHADDQAETLLMNSMRGSGVDGLAAMPAQRELGPGQLQRPLLGVTRARLHEWAVAEGVRWIEDPTNQAPAYTRNRVRHRVMPALKAEWPDAAERLSRVAEQMGETRDLLRQYARDDLRRLESRPQQLDIEGLKELGASRFAQLIRCALEHYQLPLPPRARLHTLWQQLEAGHDRVSQVAWPGVVARCWRGMLYLTAAYSEPFEMTLHEAQARLEHWAPCPQEGHPPALECKLREGGERMLRGGMHKKVKTLLQEHAIPPWQRERVGVVRMQETGAVVALLGEDWGLAADGWRLGRADGCH